MKDNKITAKASMVAHSARKLRLVADSVRELPPLTAIDYLRTMPQAAAKALLKVYLQGMANAKNNFRLSPTDMTTFSLMIDEGARGPRKSDAHAHGARFNSGIRRKLNSHITLVLVNKAGTTPMQAVEPEVVEEVKN